MVNNKTIYFKKILHLSKYRGCRECDILLSNFALHLETLSLTELELYEAFLAENDNDILAWLTRQQQSNKYQALVDKIIYTYNERHK